VSELGNLWVLSQNCSLPNLCAPADAAEVPTEKPILSLIGLVETHERMGFSIHNRLAIYAIFSPVQSVSILHRSETITFLLEQERCKPVGILLDAAQNHFQLRAKNP
jgi:hypothetical protein